MGLSTRLADLVVATAAVAAFLEPDERLIVPSGGVLRPGGWVLTRLIAVLAERSPAFDVVVPLVPPVIGAYYLALVATGVPIDPALRDRASSLNCTGLAIICLLLSERSFPSRQSVPPRLGCP